MRRVALTAWCGAAAVVAALAQRPAAAPTELRYEAEDWSTPQDAWAANRDAGDRWNLWSTDQDADKKWSGGVVLRGPAAQQDRARDEEGAPVLHTRITGIPNGTYDVLVKVGRTVGISFDGKTWQPFRGGTLLRGRDITDGTLEFWLDDRFADPNPGNCYYDYVLLTPAVRTADGVVNPGFEEGGEALVNWTWWSREGTGSAVLVTEEKHGGQRSVHITHDGERDWAFSNAARLAVQASGEYTIHAWVKAVEANHVTVATVANGEGKLLSWDIGGDETNGTHDWRELIGDVYVPAGCDEVYVRLTGGGKTDIYVDDVTLTPGARPVQVKPQVEGFARERVKEKLDRGVIALPLGAAAYVGWRLLRDDPAGIAFNVYRRAGDGEPQRVTAEPVRFTTDLVDPGGPPDVDVRYEVRSVVGDREGTAEGVSQALRLGTAKPYLSIKLDGDYRVQKVGLADLDGDGQLDFVIKQPQDNIDPYQSYWQRSPDTYKLEAYRHDGTFLWRHDLGWAIERGIWYSPYLVYDFNGDGRAEVAAKVGEGDPRAEDGRVYDGPEWCVVWDGRTGEELARTPWPDREGFGGQAGYNYASRNQMAVAYLDGRTPCLILLRGTYTIMKADAYQLVGGELQPLWQYRDKEGGRRYRGQGAHFTHCADIDGDGRDEVILGSAVIDDNGSPLWSTGLGHPDHAYVGDLDPQRPGLEIYYGIETRQQRNGMCLVDAATGKLLWGWTEPTTHVHATGTCADIDPTVPGMECYSADSVDHKPTGARWLWSCRGEILSREVDFGFGTLTAYWDGDLQRELVRGSRLMDYGGGEVASGIEGSVVAVADVLGDWREELITTVPGELRIYSTTIPATDRRVCLMQDPIYRQDVAHLAMGYPQVPTTSYCLEATAPGLSLTAVEGEQGEPACRVVVSAPLDAPVKGTLHLTADGATVAPAETAIDVAPGGRMVQTVAVHATGAAAQDVVLHASVDGLDRPLRGEVPLRLPSKPLAGVPLTQAEDFVAQGGGEVQIRDDKVGVVGAAFSHWDSQGHWLEWKVNAPTDGRYQLVVRYSAAQAARRALKLDGRDLSEQTFPSTGGFGASAAEWDHATVSSHGRPLVLELTAGEHTVRLENVDDKGLNLDYLALVPAS